MTTFGTLKPWIVALRIFDGTLTIIGSHDRKRDALLHAAELHDYPAWRGCEVFDLRTLAVTVHAPAQEVR